MRSKPLPRGMVVFGEVGLAGEIRPAPRGQERLREAAKLGFEKMVISRYNLKGLDQSLYPIDIVPVGKVEEV